MMKNQDVICARVRLHPDSLLRVRNWAKHIAERKDEALKTLSAEGVTVESVFLESTKEGDYLVYYMRSGSQEKAEIVAARSIAEIDKYHQAFKRETWAEVTHLELILDLSLSQDRG